MSEESAVVLEHHNDDFVIGMGGTGLQLLAAGWSLTSVVLTDGRLGSTEMSPERTKAVRSAEKEAEAAALGIDYESLGYGDRSLRSKQQTEGERSAVLRELEDVVDRVSPSVVFAPAANEGHPDHRATNAFAKLLTGERGRDVPLVEYPVWQIPFLSVETTSPETVLAVDIDGTIDRKCDAIRKHESQLRMYEYDRMARAFNSYVAHLYTREVDGAFAELLHAPNDGALPRSLRSSLPASDVTEKFHG